MFILLIIGSMLISLAASARVRSAFNHFSQIPTSSGATGAQVADAILRQAGIRDVEIVAQDQTLGDHYDPSEKRLVLSRENFYGNSLAAVGIAAHECGHALQHQQAYAPLEWRMGAIGAVNFVNPMLSWIWPLAIFGLVPGRLALLVFAIGTSVIMLFNLVTLPVEFDASHRAKQLLPQLGFIRSEEELAGVRKVLDAAAWTYIAAFVISLAQTLFYLIPLLTGSRDSRD